MNYSPLSLCSGDIKVASPPYTRTIEYHGAISKLSAWASHSQSHVKGCKRLPYTSTCQPYASRSRVEPMLDGTVDSHEHLQCVNLRAFCQYSHSGGGGGGAGSCVLVLCPNVTPGFAATGGCDARGVMRRMSSPSQISTGSMTSGTSSAGDHLGALAVTAAPLPCMHASRHAVLGPLQC